MTGSDKQFDILVIGGGIHGASIAWEATLRGLTVALVDKGDFGCGASAGNYRIIHGGLRYLQHADFIRLFESVNEQRIFRIIAPEAVAPLPFLIPCYGSGMRGRVILRTGLTFYDALTFWRNFGVQTKDRIPNHHMLSADEVLRVAPYLERKELRGGVVYCDLQMADPDRLTLAFVLSAASRGAVVRNYTEVVGAEVSASGLGSHIDRVKCRHVLSGEESAIAAKVVINAAGAWRSVVTNKLIETEVEPFVFSKGLQLTFPPLTGEHAIAIESKYRDSAAYVSKGNRSYFLQPWKGVTIAGTADILHTTEPDTYQITSDEIDLFIRELSELYPDPRITRENVLAAFGGLRPVTPAVRSRLKTGSLRDYGSIEVAHRDTVIVHANELGANQSENLLSVEGIKYTTTRKLAQRVVETAVRQRGLRADPSKSSFTPLNYSSVPLDPSDSELARIVRDEFVETADDLIRRRLGLAAHSLPSATFVERCNRVFDEVKKTQHAGHANL